MPNDSWTSSILSTASTFFSFTIIILYPLSQNFFCNRYDPEDSIRLSKRRRRQKSIFPEIIIISDTQILPTNIGSYLSNCNNKSQLVNYLFDIWKIKFPEQLNKCKHLFLANGTSSNTHLGKYSSNELDLVVDHEESDTKMFVCCRYDLNDNPQVSRVIISSPDTGVTIISCYQYSVELNIQDEFWFRTGTRKYKRCIAMHAIVRFLGHDICCLPPNISHYNRIWLNQWFSWY